MFGRGTRLKCPRHTFPKQLFLNTGTGFFGYADGIFVHNGLISLIMVRGNPESVLVIVVRVVKLDQDSIVRIDFQYSSPKHYAQGAGMKELSS